MFVNVVRSERIMNVIAKWEARSRPAERATLFSGVSLEADLCLIRGLVVNMFITLISRVLSDLFGR